MRKLEGLEKVTGRSTDPVSACKNKQSESEPLTIHPTSGITFEDNTETPTTAGSTGLVHTLSFAKFLTAQVSTNGIEDVTERATPTYEFSFTRALEHQSIRKMTECRQNDFTSTANFRANQS